tara:strand:- start:37 stop:1275 length:1239 start_codon:yes stop_codon:yes gene_type:complete
MTNKINSIKYLLLLSIIFFTAISCSDDEPSGEVGETEDGVPKYTVKLNIQVTDDDTSSYLLTIDDLMGDNISANGTGYEVGDTYGKFGNRFFLSDIEYENCEAYEIQETELVKVGGFLLEDYPGYYGPLNDEYFLIANNSNDTAIDNSLNLIDIEGVSIANSVNIPSTIIDSENNEYILDIKGAFLKDNQVYILNSSYLEEDDSYDEYNKAFINIFSFPELEFIKTIEDDRTSNLGQYGGNANAFEDENGDFYVFSGLSNVTYNEVLDKPSGFLKIKDNEDSFDTDYFFNLEDKGYIVSTGIYVGNGNAVVKVISAATDAEVGLDDDYSFWNGDKFYNIAVVNLYDKTLTIVNDVPLNRMEYNEPYIVEDDNVYISVSDGSGFSYVYKVNATTATATKGALIEGSLGGMYAN